MPYYSRRWRFGRRRRRTWRRRFRGPFRTRFWRRRKPYRYRVRKRKRSFIPLLQWQPKRINKLKIRGRIPLFVTTNERISNDYTFYANAIAPHYFPGGGGFSIYRFTLDSLYEQFKLVQNFWTKGNSDFPLIRYTGCKFKLWRSDKCDYIVNYHACKPMMATIDTFHSTQPTIMTLNNRHVTVPCKTNNRYRKSYKLLKIKPPSEMTNNWYLQKDFAQTPLVMLMSTSTSLDRWYASSTAQSTTIGFKSLNTAVFDFYNYKLHPTTGYIPKKDKYMFSLQNGVTDISKTPIKKLIYLGQSKEYTKGRTIESTIQNSESFETTWDRYFSTSTNWGNIFEPKYLTQEVPILTSNFSPTELKQKFKSQTTSLTGNETIGPYITQTTHQLLVECRYNPYADTGGNTIFIVPITKPEQTELHVPGDPKFKTENYPLWLEAWGFLDFERKLLGQTIDTDYQLVIQSPHINPSMFYYIPIDPEMETGRSKYRPPDTQPTVYDQLHWHPKITFQVTSVNTIASSGPGTIKLPKNISAEAHADYTFYFKLGSCGAPVQDIENPDNITTYTSANNLLQTTSLQSPEYPIEYYLYGFDQRRDTITQKAARRIQKYIESQKTIPQITGSKLDVPLLYQTETPEKTETETEEATLLELLQHQRDQQQQFRHRIIQLLINT
nr:MAG: ORF1 [TTV-like mini virus]